MEKGTRGFVRHPFFNHNFSAESCAQFRKAIFAVYATPVCEAVFVSPIPRWANAGACTIYEIHTWFVVFWISRSFAELDIFRVDLTLNLTEGQTQQVVLHLTVTVSPNAACAPISPASHIPLNARSNPSFSINPTNTIAQNARPTPIWTSSPTIRNAWNATSDPSFLSSPTDFAVNMPSTATFPPNHTNIIAVMPRSSPYSPASSIAKESGSSLTSDFSDPIASRRSSLYLYTNPTIEANGESGSGWPSNPTDSIGANLRFVPSFPTNPTSIITSLGPLQSGPSTFIIPEFEPNIDDIIQRWVHQSEAVSFLLTYVI